MKHSWLFESCGENIVNPRETLAYDPHTQITHPTILQSPSAGESRRSSGFLVTCYDTMVIEVTAMVNGESTCSMAVSFGAKSRFNKRGVKDGCDLRSGICFVVYEALTLALKVRRQSVHQVDRVLVMLDQAWFVPALTSGVKAAANCPRELILAHIRKVIYEASRQGLEVRFWLVESCTNTEVDRMAAAALPDEDSDSSSSAQTTAEHSIHASPVLSGGRYGESSRHTLAQSPASYTTDDISELNLD